MTTEHSPAAAYFRTRVLSAPPEELRLMLLEGALRFAHQGRTGLVEKDYEAAFAGLARCRDIVLELMTGVREEVAPELVGRVKALYAFLYRRLIDASTHRDLAALDEVIRLLEYERQTWAMLLDRLAAERGARASTPASGPHPASESRVALSLEA